MSAGGQHGAESVILAQKPGLILWTDDFELAKIACQWFGVRRVWTQIILGHAAENKWLAESSALESSAKLLGMNYHFTWLSADILGAAARLSEWNPDRAPLRQSIDTLDDDNVKANEQIMVSGQFFASVFQEPHMSIERQTVLGRVLDRLGKRKHGLRVVQALSRQLPRFFTLNPLRARDARDFVEMWLATSQSIVIA